MNPESMSHEIDLAQVTWPFCLLELKSALNRLAPGELLNAEVSDPMIYATIQQILFSSPDQVVEATGAGSHFKLTIRKG